MRVNAEVDPVVFQYERQLGYSGSMLASQPARVWADCSDTRFFMKMDSRLPNEPTVERVYMGFIRLEAKARKRLEIN